MNQITHHHPDAVRAVTLQVLADLCPGTAEIP